jgi:hypothetical protein
LAFAEVSVVSDLTTVSALVDTPDAPRTSGRVAIVVFTAGGVAASVFGGGAASCAASGNAVTAAMVMHASMEEDMERDIEESSLKELMTGEGVIER